ncbi:MAG: translocation/assembly module TamB [Treponema sp.]|nr:translocation/assembly module TamB [Treponema sp.]
MSIFTEKGGKKTLSRIFYIKVLIFCGIIGLTAIAMQPIQTALSRIILQIRTNFIENLEDITGMKIHYSSIRPSFTGSIDIRNLQFKKGDDPVFTVERLRIRFSFFELIIRKNFHIHTVQIEKPEFIIDAQRDKDTFDLLSKLFEGRDFEDTEKTTIQLIAEFLPQKIDYQIRRGYFLFSDKGAVYQIADLNLNIQEENGEIYLNGNFSAFYENSEIFNSIISVKTDVSFSGLCIDNLEEGKADINFSAVTFSQHEQTGRNTRQHVLFTVNPFNLAVSYDERVVNISKPMGNTSIEYYLRYFFNTGIINARVNMDEFKIGDIINLSSRLSDINHLLHLQLTGNSSFHYNTANNKMAYDVDIKGGITTEVMFDLLPDTFILNAFGNEETVYVSDFVLSSSVQTAKAGFFHGKLGFNGNIKFKPFMPSGIIFLENFGFTGNESLSAVLNVSSSMDRIKLFTDVINIAGAQFINLDVLFYLSDIDIAINASCMNDERGQLFIDAVYNRNQNQFEASLSLIDISFYEISEIVRPFINYISTPVIGQAFLKDSSVNADVFFSTDFKNIVYNAPNIIYKTANYNGEIALSGTDRQFTLSEGIIFLDESNLYFSANINFSNPMDLNFLLNASYHNIAWRVTGQLLDRRTLIIHDPNGLHVYGNVSSTGAISGYIETIDFPVLINAQTVYLSSYSALRYTSQDFWTIDINHFLAIYDGEESLRFSGIADHDGASFRNILYTDSLGILAGSLDLSWDNDFSYVELIVNMTDGLEAGENYYMEGVYKDNQINAYAVVTDLQVRRFLKESRPLLANGEMIFSWDSINLFNINLNITSIKSINQNDPFYASFNINVTNDELSVNHLNIEYPEMKIISPEIYININEGILKTKTSFHGFAMDNRLEGLIDINGSFNKINTWLEIENALNLLDGIITFENSRYGHLYNANMDFNFSVRQGEISITGGIKDFLRFKIENDGNFILGLSSPFPIHGTFTGIYKDGIVDASCANIYIDMYEFWNLMPDIKDFIVTSGFLTGNMDFKGPIENPEFYGVLRGSSITIQVPNFVSENIRPMPFTIIAEGNQMTFGPIIAAAGNGGGIVNGFFLFQNWIPVNIILDINIPRESPVPYGFNVSGFLADGTASGKLLINIDIDNYIELKGDLFTNYAEIGFNTDVINNNENELVLDPFNTYMDLNVTTGSMVEFTWPIVSPIIKANVEIGTLIHIFTDTQAGQFSLNSDVRIRSGEINYFGRSFFIRQANILFRENETQFNPRVTARAEIRERIDTGNVTISMIIENQPLLSFEPGFEPRFESNPSLSMLEIYSILGQTFSRNPGEENNDMATRFLITSTSDFLTQIIASSDVFSQFVFFRQIERQMRDFLRLDMFSVRTRFFHNAFMSGFSGFGQNSIDSETGVGNYLDNTTVFIGKYIGRDMFIHGMLRMRYDENNTTFGGMVFEPDIGIELQSPFVNIRWDFFPYRPENWWLSGNSITLSWSMSF